MSPTSKPQAISGVSAGVESHLSTRYPSIAATYGGKLLGGLFESIPVKLGTVKLSHILFTLLFSPVGILLYAWQKVAGERFVLTTRSLQKWKMLGKHMLAEVPLNDIASIDVEQSGGQVFYKAGDLVICNAAGNVLMRLEGVVRPAVFRQSILETRDSRQQVEASLNTIQARQTA